MTKVNLQLFYKARKILKIVLNKSTFEKIKKLYWKIYYLLHNTEKEIAANESVLKELGIDLNQIKEINKKLAVN